MVIQIDFTLSQSFGAVEQTIFRLVLNGLTDAKQISRLLALFSDEVIANAIMKLVNSQILRADVEGRKLSLSEPVRALIEKCNDNSFELALPDNLSAQMEDGRLLISDRICKEEILAGLLPNIKLDFMARALDLYLCEQGAGQ